ncbi:transmembrane protein 234 homolog isoform X2 [Ptychodera flava]|uniref:transmembrane protein 234 homolog isoform X2 n=1 Tax=Ptychodera flava TaxID=63121 RepID=UPI003969BD81
MIYNAVWLTVVAFLWGATNPLIKQGSAGIDKIQKSNAVWQFVAEITFLATNWKYIVPFLINQSGSLVYYPTLASVDLSLAVPITNSLTFIFTTLTGKILGEKIGNKETYIGMVFVVAGVSLCVMDEAFTGKS